MCENIIQIIDFICDGLLINRCTTSPLCQFHFLLIIKNILSICIKSSPSCPYINDSTQFIDFVYWFRASSWIENKNVTNFPKI